MPSAAEAKQILKNLRKQLKEDLRTPQTALKSLQRAGLVTRSGKPRKIYARNLTRKKGRKSHKKS